MCARVCVCVCVGRLYVGQLSLCGVSACSAVGGSAGCSVFCLAVMLHIFFQVFVSGAKTADQLRNFSQCS